MRSAQHIAKPREGLAKLFIKNFQKAMYKSREYVIIKSPDIKEVVIMDVIQERFIKTLKETMENWTKEN